MPDRAANTSDCPAHAQPTQSAGASGSAGSSTDRPVQAADGYAGDVSPQTAWQWVQDGVAVIVDVRSDAEREWVGFVPGAVSLAWKQWPEMQINPGFATGLQQFDANTRLLMLCRSGVRSIAAARAAAGQGFQAFNVLEGFEGDRDAQQHRGQLGGWKRRGLPWGQN